MITNITDKERELQAKLKQYEAVMRQALEVLENSRALEPVDIDWVKGKRHAIIIALREALKDGTIKRAEEAYEAAKQRKWEGLSDEQQEPVGYWDGEFSKDGGATLYEVPQESLFGRKYRNSPLYERPQAREPLTDDEICDVYMNSTLSDCFITDVHEFARLIEAAHGIKP